MQLDSGASNTTTQHGIDLEVTEQARATLSLNIANVIGVTKEVQSEILVKKADVQSMIECLNEANS